MDAADIADIAIAVEWIPVGPSSRWGVTTNTALGENMEKYSNLRQFLA